MTARLRCNDADVIAAVAVSGDAGRGPDGRRAPPLFSKPPAQPQRQHLGGWHRPGDERGG